ncbi:MAG: hypothetical protein ABMA25_03040 [Ilumatobacteraceae bacterium]
MADIELITQWYGDGFVDDGTSTNDCRYRSEYFGSVHISARRADGDPSVQAQFQYNDPTPEFDDELLAAYLDEAAYGAARTGASVADRVATLTALPDGKYPCSTTFFAGNERSMIATYVTGSEGESVVGPLSVVFGSSLLVTSCNDEVDDNQQQPTVDERWPASYSEITMELPSGSDCGPATVHLVGVKAFPPDGTIVELGDMTMTNTNWMIEPPFECRRT